MVLEDKQSRVLAERRISYGPSRSKSRCCEIKMYSPFYRPLHLFLLRPFRKTTCGGRNKAERRPNFRAGIGRNIASIRSGDRERTGSVQGARSLIFTRLVSRRLGARRFFPARRVTLVNARAKSILSTRTSRKITKTLCSVIRKQFRFTLIHRVSTTGSVP